MKRCVIGGVPVHIHSLPTAIAGFVNMPVFNVPERIQMLFFFISPYKCLGYTGFLFKSTWTRNGPTGASFILSTFNLFQVVANKGEFCLIYDTWYFISYEKFEKRRLWFQVRRFMYVKWKCAFRNGIRPPHQIAYKTTTNDRILMK